ncbi:MAG TPA: Wzz/FepE/Etk N-terminal domain-containing protein, partial [Acidimicrobiales bacterium]|nr:Wzz/FepE/Etk N-terminal domain-containing protein [Acidimicrobiales bacterium]
MLPHEAAAEPDLRDYLQVLRRRKFIIAISVVIVTAVALGLSYRQTPKYAGVAKLLLNPTSTQSVFDTNSQQYVDPVRAVQTEIEVIGTEPVQDLVRQKIGSAPPVQVAPVGQTNLVTIRAVSTSASRAAIVANAYAGAYIDFRRKQAFDNSSAASEQVQAKITDLQRQIDSLGSTTANLPACVDPKTTPDACNQRTAADASVTAQRTTLISQLGLFQQRLDQLQVDSSLSSGGAQLITPAS